MKIGTKNGQNELYYVGNGFLKLSASYYHFQTSMKIIPSFGKRKKIRNKWQKIKNEA